MSKLSWRLGDNKYWHLLDDGKETGWTVLSWIEGDYWIERDNKLVERCYNSEYKRCTAYGVQSKAEKMYIKHQGGEK